MAVHVEDHPIEYIDFEGVIPAGEYGGGDVIVWDSGTWEPHSTDDPGAAVAAGELHAEVHGEKLRGRFVLVRRDRRATDGKRAVAAAAQARRARRRRAGTPRTIPVRSVSGRTNDEVEGDPDRLWRSELPAAEASVSLVPDAAARTEASTSCDALGKQGRLGGVRPRAAGHQPRQGAVPGRGARRR